ncbi:hypothetical protein [Cellulomonas sp. PhB150]|uniref:hypothetical protein n=1 Tax=Cellulomonas sp. PhB150 TaxID=2485188 RepID=UPI000F4AE348|nr:hypothetical protein [Cellulomonas sp. PhB150]ROS26159.1 hypothetical protein EDF34_2488 [Cellulomonas sp. PhB150]
MTGSALEPTPIALYLPDDWWIVDVASEPARERSIAALVARQVGRADDRAALRAEIRTALGKQARDAARAGAFLLAISLMQVGEARLPAALAAYRLPRSGGGELHSLERAFAPLPSDGLELVVADRGSVLRRTWVDRATAREPAPDTRVFRADYWLDLPGAAEIVLLTFSTPLVEAADAFLELFDTIVDTVDASTGASAREVDTLVEHLRRAGGSVPRR